MRGIEAAMGIERMVDDAGPEVELPAEPEPRRARGRPAAPRASAKKPRAPGKLGELPWRDLSRPGGEMPKPPPLRRP